MISVFFVSPFIIFKFDEDNIAFMQAITFYQRLCFPWLWNLKPAPNIFKMLKLGWNIFATRKDSRLVLSHFLHLLNLLVSQDYSLLPRIFNFVPLFFPSLLALYVNVVLPDYRFLSSNFKINDYAIHAYVSNCILLETF